MWKSMGFCHVSHFMKRIDILLSYIRDKNKFKNMGSLFPLVQCFKATFCYIFYLMFKDYYLFNLVQCFKISHLSHTQKTLCISINYFTFTLLYTHAYSSSCNSISNTLKKEKKTEEEKKTMSFTFNLSMTPA